MCAREIPRLAYCHPCVRVLVLQVRSRLDALDATALRVEKLRAALRASTDRIVATAGGAADAMLTDARAAAAGLGRCPDCGEEVPAAYIAAHRGLCRAPKGTAAAAAAGDATSGGLGAPAAADEELYFGYGVEFPPRTAPAAAATVAPAAAAAAAAPPPLDAAAALALERAQRAQKKRDRKRGGPAQRDSPARAGAAVSPAAVSPAGRAGAVSPSVAPVSAAAAPGGVSLAHSDLDDDVCGPPGPPLNVRIEELATTHSSVTLSWEPPLFDGGAPVCAAAAASVAQQSSGSRSLSSNRCLLMTYLC